MSTILRDPGLIYNVRYDKVPLDVVANSERTFPKEWIAASRVDVTDDFVRYAQPLIGENWPNIGVKAAGFSIPCINEAADVIFKIEAAFAAAEIHAGAGLIKAVEVVEAGLLPRFPGGAESELAMAACGFVRVGQVGGNVRSEVEILDLRGELRRERARVEQLVGAGGQLAGHHRRPRVFDIVAERIDRAHARDDYSSFVTHASTLRRTQAPDWPPVPKLATTTFFIATGRD